LRHQAREPGAVIVVEVPGAEWVDPIAETWHILIHGTDEISFDGGGDQERPYRRLSKVEPRWAEFRRDGSARRHRPEDGNGAVRTKAASGRPVYGFSPSPVRCLPSDLLRVATAGANVWFGHRIGGCCSSRNRKQRNASDKHTGRRGCLEGQPASINLSALEKTGLSGLSADPQSSVVAGIMS
jgi:hypothetical protein